MALIALILGQPFLKVGELYRPGLHELPAGKAADPVVMDPQGQGYGAVLPYPFGDLFSGLLDAFFYRHGLDTKVVTCHYNSTFRGDAQMTYRTKLSREQLIENAKALGFDHTDNAALMCAAMVSDPEFRERVIRLNFEKALRDVR